MANKAVAPTKKTIYKQPWETWIVGADFSKVLQVGEALVNATSDIIAIDEDGVDVAATLLDNASKAVTTADADDISVTPITNGMLVTRIEGGTAGAKYLVTYKAVTDAGNQFEIDVKVNVKSPSL